MKSGRAALWALAIFLEVLGCATTSEPTPDAGGCVGAECDGEACTTDLACSDGVFCNGQERCRPGDPGADETGCVAGGTPCAAGQDCIETEAVCRSDCGVTVDADGDGAIAIECDGSDCDDSDADRYPGNTELCDDEGHDEDCDPSTVGDRDVDLDGHVDALCCNERCGDDCDDERDEVHPGAGEICNLVDDDCDGSADEGVQRHFFADADRDGFGDRLGEPVLACTLPDGRAENTLDCDDTRAESGPGRTEICDGFDDDCDSAVDEAAATAPECAFRFGSPPHTSWACVDGGCQVVCSAARADCNGDGSDGCESVLAEDPHHCGGCGIECGVGGECLDGVCDEVVDVEVGNGFACAIRAPSGRVVCWGDNAFGQRGDGTFSGGPPRPVLGLSSVETLTLSMIGAHPHFEPTAFACAMTNPPSVQCWGTGARGELGRGVVGEIALTPRSVSGLPTLDRVISRLYTVDANAYTVCAAEIATTAATLRISCWGQNLGGMIDASAGAGAVFSEPTIVVDFGENPASLAVGGTFFCHSAYPRSGAATTRCRGQGTAVGVHRGELHSPIDAGWDFVCGITESGVVQCWGDNGSGQLGIGTTTASPTPVSTSVTGARLLATGTWHACAVSGASRVRCWGGRTFPARTMPTEVMLPTSDRIVDIGAGDEDSCAVTDRGDVYCWGPDLVATRVEGL